MARYCENCNQDMGREITSRRRFCSDKCRVQFNRAQKANDLYFDAMSIIYKLGKSPKTERLKAIETLRNLKPAIDDALRTLGDRETIDKFSMIDSLARKR